jgi:hypothetical protein
MGAMITYYMDGIYLEIENAVKRLQRNLRRGVLPKHVQPYLPYDRAEGSIRRDMGQMWVEGKLVRVGGTGARQGYRCATDAERSFWSRVLDVLVFIGRAGQDDLAGRLGVELEIAETVLNWLAEIGRVIRLADGRYRLPSRIEALAWSRCGCWPYGAERAA